VNIVIVVFDTLRLDHIGAMGNDWIQTPNFDRFAAQSVVFTAAYPESLPTLPMRRGLYTGARVYPFADHKYQKGDFAGAPGWGPMREERHTISEVLSAAGYRTGLISDVYHQFKPSKNFHRGFDQCRARSRRPTRSNDTWPSAIRRVRWRSATATGCSASI
jgi:arylsulfatase A-like enzyme